MASEGRRGMSEGRRGWRGMSRWTMISEEMRLNVIVNRPTGSHRRRPDCPLPTPYDRCNWPKSYSPGKTSAEVFWAATTPLGRSRPRRARLALGSARSPDARLPVGGVT